MDIEKIIKKKIEHELSPMVCEVVNESHKHIGHAGDNGTGQTHFKLLIVSSQFENKNSVARQRLVYSIINEAFSLGLHAVSMNLKTEKEYKI